MKILNKKAVSVLEYIVLFIIVMSAFLIMKHYIQRGLFGSWAKSGQSFAYGRQYDPQKTIECAFDEQSNQWYDRNCYDYYVKNQKCNGDINCETGITTGICSVSSGSSCEQLNNGASP